MNQKEKKMIMEPKNQNLKQKGLFWPIWKIRTRQKIEEVEEDEQITWVTKPKKTKKGLQTK